MITLEVTQNAVTHQKRTDLVSDRRPPQMKREQGHKEGWTKAELRRGPSERTFLDHRDSIQYSGCDGSGSNQVQRFKHEINSWKKLKHHRFSPFQAGMTYLETHTNYTHSGCVVLSTHKGPKKEKRRHNHRGARGHMLFRSLMTVTIFSGCDSNNGSNQVRRFKHSITNPQCWKQTWDFQFHYSTVQNSSGIPNKHIYTQSGCIVLSMLVFHTRPTISNAIENHDPLTPFAISASAKTKKLIYRCGQFISSRIHNHVLFFAESTPANLYCDRIGQIESRKNGYIETKAPYTVPHATFAAV